ncbi:MAG: hypothetical protein ACO1NY_06360 [Pseudorhodoplanes sp.]
MVDADQEARPEDRLGTAMHRAVFALLVALACGAALAHAQSPGPAVPQTRPAAGQSDDSKLDLQKPESDAPQVADSWWQKVLREAPNCKSFTDGCRTCSQTVCSNIGIACQPKDWSCNDVNLNAKPESKTDEKPQSKQ